MWRMALMDQERIQKIKERRFKIASSEWRVELSENRGYSVWGLVSRTGSMLIAAFGHAETFDKDNAEFVANAPEDIDYLLAEIDSLSSQLRR